MSPLVTFFKKKKNSFFPIFFSSSFPSFSLILGLCLFVCSYSYQFLDNKKIKDTNKFESNSIILTKQVLLYQTI